MDPLARYFEPVSRLQLASKLRHLLRFSDLVLLIVGQNGSGKSTLLRQLEAEESQSGIRQASIHCDETVDVTRLLTVLVSTLGVDCDEDADNRTRLKALHAFSRTLHESGTRLVLLFDDADYLTNNALELLINFALLEQGAPRIALSGMPEFEQRFIDNGFDQLIDGRMHVQTLAAFESEEAVEFIETLLPPGTQLSSRKMRSLIDQSEGLPGRLHAGVVRQMRQGGVTRGNAQPFPIPGLYMGVIAVILLSIVAGSIWIYLPENEEPAEPAVARVVMPIDIPAATVGSVDEVVDVRSELQQKLAEQERKLESEVADSADEVIIPNDAVPDEPVADNEPEKVTTAGSAGFPTDKAVVESAAVAVQTSPGMQASTEQKTTEAADVPAKVTDVVEEQPVPAVAARTAPVAESNIENGTSLLRADELLQWPDKGYTLQLLGAREVASVEDFIKAQSNPERFYYFRTIYKGAPWHVVVYGQFSDRASAMAAVQTLPAELRKLRPWARSIAGVKSDIGKQ